MNKVLLMTPNGRIQVMINDSKSRFFITKLKQKNMKANKFHYFFSCQEAQERS